MKKILSLIALTLPLISFASAAQTPINQATASWTPPTAYTDNTPLTVGQITGYTVWYGTSSGNYTSSVAVPSAGGVTPTTVTITGLTPNLTYYFAVTVSTTNGLTSAYSSEVSKYIPTTLAAPNAPTLLSITFQIAPATVPAVVNKTQSLPTVNSGSVKTPVPSTK